MLFLTKVIANNFTEEKMSDSIFYKKLGIYLLLLFSILITLGTFTLALIIKSMVVYMRHTGWLANSETWLIIALLIALVFFSLLFAKWLTLWLIEGLNREKITSIVLISLLFLIALIYWIPRNEFAFTSNMATKDNRFIGGPYPDAKTLARLKTEGYTTIISLLDPLTFPSETLLIREEDKAVADLGLNLIRIPMLSSRLTTIEADKRIEALAKSPANEKYYVHAFRDPARVTLFITRLNILIPDPVKIEVPAALKRPEPVVMTTYSTDTLSLERGTARQLDNHVMVSPQPSLDEIEKYFLTTPNPSVKLSIRTVVSLNADETPEQASEINALLKAHNINYLSMPIKLYPYSADSVLKIADKIRSLSGGVLVYSYYMPPQSTAASAFIISYLSNLPSVPASLFKNIPMQRGEVKVIAPNVAIGPRPHDVEFKDYLDARGIRVIGYVGPCEDQEAQQDSVRVKAINLKWVCLQDKDTINMKLLKTGGPWYVYGPTLSLIETELTRRMNVMMPQHTALVNE